MKGATDKEDIISFSSVPNCLQSSLEYIEMTLVKYFLENSVLLEKFTLRLDCPIKEQESIIVMEVARFQRCSSACEVNVVTPEDDVCVF